MALYAFAGGLAAGGRVQGAPARERGDDVRITCPACGASGTLKGARAMKSVRCPKCGQRFRPEEADDTEPVLLEGPPEPPRPVGGGLRLAPLDTPTGEAPAARRPGGPPPLRGRRGRAPSPPRARGAYDRYEDDGYEDEDGGYGYDGDRGYDDRERRPRRPSRPRRRPRAYTFQVGDVISKTFSTWIHNFLPFTLLSLIVFFPKLLMSWAVFAGGFRLAGDPEIANTIFSNLATLLFGPIVTGAVTYGVIQQLRGRHASMGACVSEGLRSIVLVIVVGLLRGLCVIAPILVGVLVMVMGAAAGGVGGFAIGGLLVLAGIIPAIIIALVLWVAVPAVVIERVGAIEALKRSALLTKGDRGSIFLVIFVLQIIAGILGAIFGAIGAAVAIASEQNAPLVIAIITVLIEAVAFPLQATSEAVGYHELRMAKEGVDVEQLAAVFD